MQRETIYSYRKRAGSGKLPMGIQSASGQTTECMVYARGKVAVYTGILPVTKDDNGLAVVMGHEISHALAGHGNERISQATLAQYGGQLVGASLSNGQMASIFNQLYPMGAQVGLWLMAESRNLKQTKWDSILWLWRDMIHVQHRRSGKECRMLWRRGWYSGIFVNPPESG
jgi:hypothetical protein